MKEDSAAHEKQKPNRLKPIQLKAMDLILAGFPLQEVADTLNVSRQTVSHWKNHDEQFRAKLAELHSEAEDELSRMLPANSAHMLSRLVKLADQAPPAIALDAVKYFFERFGPKQENLDASEAGYSPQDAALLRALRQRREEHLEREHS